MTNSYSDRHPELDIDASSEVGIKFFENDKIVKRQLALLRFRRLKLLKKEKLTLDDKLFIDNFEVATRLWWKLKL